MREFHHGLGHVQHGCKNEVVLPLSLLQTLQYIRAQGHVQFPSFVVPKPTWQSVVQPAPAGHHPLPLASLCARRGTPEVRLWLVSIMSLCLWMSCPFAFGKPVRPPWNARGAPLARVHHVPLPLASPCARRGTPEVRPWLVSIMSLCLWQARAPAVERPRCAFGCLCLPCLHVMSLCLWQARAPAVERPRCAFGCLSLSLAFMSCFCLAFLTYML